MKLRNPNFYGKVIGSGPYLKLSCKVCGGMVTITIHGGVIKEYPYMYVNRFETNCMFVS